MIALFFLSIIIPLFSLFLQSYPRFFNKYFGVDVWTRLLEIEHVKKNKHKIPEKIKKGFIIDGYFDYPIIFPWIFSFFSKKTLLKIQGLVSPFFDSIQNLLVFYVAFSLTNDIYIALLSQLMYSLIPIIPIENSYLTPRSLGYLNFTLAFYPMLLFHINGQIIFYFISFFFTCTLFLTHRFALQSLVFISIFFTFIDGSILYLINIVTAFLLISAITKGFYLRVLKGHLYNIYFWVKNYQHRFSHQIYSDKKNKKSDWVSRIYSLLSMFSPFFMFGMNVWAFSAVVYFILFYMQDQNLPDNILYLKMAIWIIFFYVFGAVILKFKKLIPIGEGQRYMEMSTVPSVILASVLFFSYYKVLGIILLFVFIAAIITNLFLILAIQIKGIISDKNRSLTKDLRNIYNFINSKKNVPRIMCIPHQITTMTVYNTKADVLVNADNKGLMQIQDIYPVLKKPIRYFKKKYSLDYLLLRETYAKLSDLKLQKSKIIFRSGDVLLVKI
jgi:hypothetical protein